MELKNEPGAPSRECSTWGPLYRCSGDRLHCAGTITITDVTTGITSALFACHRSVLLSRRSHCSHVPVSSPCLLLLGLIPVSNVPGTSVGRPSTWLTRRCSERIAGRCGSMSLLAPWPDDLCLTRPECEDPNQEIPDGTAQQEKEDPAG